MAFDDDTALTAVADGAWEGWIGSGWDTPRGPLGGYVMAIVLRALDLAVGDPDRSARTATMHFLRVPESGPVLVRAQVERTGRSLTTVSGRLEQEGKLLGLALAAYSKPWQSPLLDGSPMPGVEPADANRAPLRVPDAGDGEVGSQPVGNPGAKSSEFPRPDPPAFTERLAMQHRFGDPPWSSSDEALAGGWLGLVEERPLDALAIALLADAWFPAPWPRLKALAPAPTIELTIHFRVSLPLPDSLLLGRFRSGLVRDGFFDEDGALWAPDGTLVAQSRQLGLLIGAEA